MAEHSKVPTGTDAKRWEEQVGPVHAALTSVWGTPELEELDWLPMIVGGQMHLKKISTEYQQSLRKAAYLYLYVLIGCCLPVQKSEVERSRKFWIRCLWLCLSSNLFFLLEVQRCALIPGVDL